jgi:hypothetical protein
VVETGIGDIKGGMYLKRKQDVTYNVIEPGILFVTVSL